ncbi:hypothetical protein EDD11_006349 [Mortierella claussenii]|nr:hypothetical protein EDD11_006349 [Mortierella claussenii]
MTSAAGYRSLGPSKGVRTRKLVVLVLIIFVTAWTLFRSVDFIRLGSSSKNNSPGSSVDNSIVKPQLQQQRQEQQQPQQQQPHQGEEASEHHHDMSQDDGLPIAPEDLKPAMTFLDPNVRYLSFLPFGGLTNQFIGFQAAAFAAKRLNRTLILPPIVSNTHDHDNTHQRWSRYFDLPRFTHLTGVPVLEWDLVRPLTSAQRKVGRRQALFASRKRGKVLEEWAQVAENITCQIAAGYGGPNLTINHSGRNFAYHFLIRPIPVQPPLKQPNNPYYNRTMLAETGKEVLFIVDDLVARYQDSEDQLLFFTNMFKLKDLGNNRFSAEIGENIHFVPQLMEYATRRVNEEIQNDPWIEVLPNDDPEEQETKSPQREQQLPLEPAIPKNNNTDATDSGEVANPATANITAPTTRIPHIAVHLRRGDIWLKCKPQNRDACLLPLSRYVDAVAQARTIAAQRGLHSRLPVVVTTDTASEDDIRQIQELGWHRIEHEQYGTADLWGSFGAAMVDAAILAHADEFVGSAQSTMSRVAAMRQRAWYKREALYPTMSQKLKNRIMT